MNKDMMMQMLTTINCDYEIGIWSETNDYFEREENIEEFTLNFEQDCFNLSINLKEFSLIKVKSVFHSFVKFIEYNSTFYVRQDNDEYIEYYLLSSMENQKGFLFRIKFFNNWEALDGRVN